MPDLLVRLYDLPDITEHINRQNDQEICIRRAVVPEKHIVTQWVKQTFNPMWANECEVAFAHKPVSCLIAVKQDQVVGFSCYETTCKGFFGPIGLAAEMRGKGLGKTLLTATLKQMANEGHAYAIIGRATGKVVEFYTKTVGAMPVAGSEDSIYKGMLREKTI